jgi:hypothetical protein
MGCIARLGCLAVLLLLGFGAWLTKDRWLSRFHPGSPPAAADHPTWQRLSAAGARRANSALESLSSRAGPVFQNVSAGDASAYVFDALLGKLPDDVDSAEAVVIGERLHVRAWVRLRDLGGSAVLGPLAAVLGERERLELAGTFHVIRPGLAEFEVKEAKLRDLTAPEGLIPKLLRAMTKGDRPAGLSEDGIVVHTPSFLGDVRIANGRVTLYKGQP